MSYPVLICDDSALARKQMARSLPASLQADVTFAVHGRDALDKIATHSFKLMFLDLTMPELDGFGTLEELKRQNIDLDVVVVSGDIQPKARERVLELGAKAFVKKPIDQNELKQFFAHLGYYLQLLK